MRLKKAITARFACSAAALSVYGMSPPVLVGEDPADSPVPAAPTPPVELVPYPLDFGPYDGAGNEPAVVGDAIQMPGVRWMRVRFGDCNLGSASYLVLRSSADGGTQRLDAHSLRYWKHKSAFFNGGAVEVELHVAPQDRGVFVQIPGIQAGGFGEPYFQPAPGMTPRSLCGADNRVTSTDNRVCRVAFLVAPNTLSPGCTAWLVSNGAALTAGHCVDFDPDGAGSALPDGIVDAELLDGVVEFDVPPSLSNGTNVLSAPEDQYPVSAVADHGFSGEADGILGDDFAVFSLNPNSSTGGVAHLERGFHRVTRETPALDATIRITGFGVDQTPAGSGGGRNANSETNQTSTGTFEGEDVNVDGTISHTYATDTEGGNSGSPILWEANNVAIGIHTNGGCASDGSGANSGTSFEHNPLEIALNDFPNTTAVFVDVGMPVLVAENGTIYRPFNLVPEGVTAVATGGTLVIVEGNYTGTAGNILTIGADGKAMTILAPVGGVVIGN